MKSNCEDQNGKVSIECSQVKTTLRVIGGKWKPLILFVLGQDTFRFSELQKAISGITQKMLTQQLRELEADGLITRKVYPQVPPRVEYTITKFGKSLDPIFQSMDDWGRLYTKKIKSHR